MEAIVEARSLYIDPIILYFTSRQSREDKSEVDKEKIEEGLCLEKWVLEESATQLTFYGIIQLTKELKEEQLCVFYRNNHFSTMYKRFVNDNRMIKV